MPKSDKITSPSKKMVCIIPALALGGSDRSLIKFTNVMSELGWKVDIIICIDKLDLSHELDPNIKVHLIRGLSLKNPLLWYKTRKLILKLESEIIVSWSSSANLLALLARMPWDKRRILISEREYMPEVLRIRNSNYNSMRTKIRLTLIKLLYKHATIVTANSPKSIRFLRSYIGKGPTYLHMPNIIDTAISQSIKKHAPADISHLSHNSPRILALGRLEYQKGFDILLEAMASVKHKREWKLVIVGEGSKKDELRARTRNLGIDDLVLWLGSKTDPFPYYNWADIVVVPSRYDGFANVPLEAMACRCAVICTDCLTGPRELTEDGRFGVLVPTNDPKALASAIIRLGDNPALCHTIGESAFKHVKSNYDISVIAPIYKDIVEQLHGRI